MEKLKAASVVAKSVADTAAVTAMDVAGVRLFQRHSLIDAADYLRLLRERETADADRNFLAIACTLTAHAACEAILNEWSSLVAPALYSESCHRRRWSLMKRAETFSPLVGVPLQPGLADLCDAKNALAHAMPDKDRTLRIGAWIAGDSPERAVEVVLQLDEAFFPGGPPVRPALTAP